MKPIDVIEKECAFAHEYLEMMTQEQQCLFLINLLASRICGLLPYIEHLESQVKEGARNGNR